jgi:hypothetical protein
MSDTQHNAGDTIITPVVRSSFNNLFVPRAGGKNPKSDDKKRYSILGLILPPEKMWTDLDRERWTQLQRDVIAVGQKAMGADRFKNFLQDGKIKRPIRTDIKSSGYPEEFACYLRAWSYQQPGVVSIYRDPTTKKAATITDPNQVFSGCWVRLSVRPWCRFHEEGGWSIGLQLQNVQWVKDDSRLDGKISAENEFDAEQDMPEAELTGMGGGAGRQADSKDELAALLGA